MTTEQLQSFVAGVIRHATTLPASQCVAHLRTATQLLGDIPEADRLRRLYQDLNHTHQQLELLADNQLSLTIDP